MTLSGFSNDALRKNPPKKIFLRPFCRIDGAVCTLMATMALSGPRFCAKSDIPKSCVGVLLSVCVRHISLGEALLRVAGSVLLAWKLEALQKHFAASHCRSGQYALQEGGAEHIVHKIRALLRGDSNMVCIALDAKNAFNSIERDSILSQLVGEFAPLRGYFKTAYSRNSRLLFRSGSVWEEIVSCRGGKQGDTAMPAFFSLGIHPVIVDIGLKFGVSVFGYLDDITIVGRPDQAIAAVLEIERRLKLIGLDLNKTKCEVYGCASQSVAAKLGFRPKLDGIKVLGAWVSIPIGDPSTKAFLEKQLAEHKKAIEAICALPPDVAFPLLVSCGIPRWNFIVRTHSTVDAAEATKEFDVSIQNAFMLITKTSNLSPRQLLHLHVPQRMGGFGLTNFSLISAAAHAASLDPSSDSQDVRVEIINRELVAKLRLEKPFSKHLERCAKRLASSWMMATDCACPDQAGFVAGLQSRLQWHPNTKKTLVRCACGFMASPQEVEEHAPGCKGKNTNELTFRHRGAQAEMGAICREAGVFAEVEPLCGGLKRADHLFFPALGPLLVDYTICNEQAQSYADKTSDQIVASKETKKMQHYKEGLEGRRFKTFYLDTQGGWSNDAISVVEEIVENSSITKQHAIRRVSKRTMCATGRMILNIRKQYWTEEPSASSTTTPRHFISVFKTPLQASKARSLRSLNPRLSVSLLTMSCPRAL